MGITENNSSHPIATSLFSLEAFPSTPLKRGVLVCVTLLAMSPLTLSAYDLSAYDLKATARLNVSGTYTDNVSLAPRGSEKSDFVINVSPAISVTRDTGRVKANLDYTLQNLIYLNDSSRNSSNHQLGATANAELIKQFFFLDASASVGQQNISTLGPVGIDNTSKTGNVTTVSTYSLSPRLQHRFGTFASTQVRYTHDGVFNASSAIADSTSDSVDMNLNSGTSFNDFSWGLNYHKQRVNYSQVADTELESYSATIGYLLTRKLRVFGTTGREKNNFQTAGSSVDGPFWNAGFSWAPTSRTTFSASTGHRFFGKTYSLNLDHRTRRTSWNATYTESLSSTRTVQSQFLGTVYLYLCSDGTTTVPLVSSPALAQSNCQQKLRNPIITVLLIGAGNISSLSLLNENFINKNFIGSMSLQTGKSTVTFAAFNTRRELQLSGTLDRQYGGVASWSWRLAPYTVSTLSSGWSRNIVPASKREDDLWNIGLGFSHQLRPKLGSTLNFRHQVRNSNQANADFKENSITAGLNMSF